MTAAEIRDSLRRAGVAGLTHVLLDFFGTLIAYSPSRVAQGYPRSFALVRGEGASLDYPGFLERWDRTSEALEQSAEQSHDEYPMDAACARFLADVLGRPVEDELVVRFRDTYLSEWNKGVAHIPGVSELLAELAQRYTLVLVSNTNHAEFVRAHLRAMDVAHRFTAIVTSIEHGKRKPSPAIFEHALACSGGERAAATYVGDSFAADYLGARGAGLRCLLIDPERRHNVPDSDRLATILELRDRLR